MQAPGKTTVMLRNLPNNYTRDMLRPGRASWALRGVQDTWGVWGLEFSFWGVLSSGSLIWLSCFDCGFGPDFWHVRESERDSGRQLRLGNLKPCSKDPTRVTSSLLGPYLGGRGELKP